MISIEINLLSIYFQFIWIYFQLMFLLNQKTKNTQKNAVHNRYHPDNYIIEDLGHSWGTPLKNCLGAVFNKDLIKHLIMWETLHFRALTWILLSRVNGPALPKERWIKGFVF